jgi:hypothetical protein
MRPKAAHARKLQGISLHPCALASLRCAVPHRLNGCALEIQEIAALSRPLEFGGEIHGQSAGTWNPAATKPGAAISSLAACFTQKRPANSAEDPFFSALFAALGIRIRPNNSLG